MRSFWRGHIRPFLARLLWKGLRPAFEARLRHEFDPEWYRGEYPDATPDQDPFAHYLSGGAKRGYSPNAWFDEAFYVSFYTDVADAIADGRVLCGFAHYLAFGRAEARLTRHEVEAALERRMPGVTQPALIPQIDFIRSRLAPIPTIKTSRPTRIIWFLMPTLNPDIMFGGYRCGVELIKSLVDKGSRVNIVICAEELKDNKEYFQYHFRNTDLARSFSGVEVFNRSNLSSPLEIGSSDRFFAYSTWEAHLAHRLAAFTDEPRFVFLVQEYEPIFHEHGSEYAMSDAAYDLPHFPIFNSDLLRSFFKGNRLGVFRQNPSSTSPSEHVVVEHALSGMHSTLSRISEKKNRSRRLVMYARPERHASRNLFPLGVLGLQQAIEQGIIDGSWEIFGVGALSSGRKVPLARGYELFLKPRMDSERYVKFLAETDVGLCLMYGPHPGLVSHEMARVGARVVMNTFNNRSAKYLRGVSENFIPCAPTITGIASGLEEAISGLPDIDSRMRGSKIQGPSSWEQVFDACFFKKLADFC